MSNYTVDIKNIKLVEPSRISTLDTTVFKSRCQEPVNNYPIFVDPTIQTNFHLNDPNNGDTYIMCDVSGRYDMYFSFTTLVNNALYLYVNQSYKCLGRESFKGIPVNQGDYISFTMETYNNQQATGYFTIETSTKTSVVCDD